MMPAKDFIKMPRSTSGANDGTTEYIINAGDSEKEYCCDTWCANKKDPNGFVCCTCCYRQNCVMMNGVFLCFSIIISISVLIGLAVTSGKPHIETLFFVEGECTTVKSNITDRQETCNCGGRFCTATFPCLEIFVSYTDGLGNQVESLLHENEFVYTYTPHCSYQPENCIQSQNVWYVNYYKEKWGSPGLSFPCHHHPSRGAAIRRRTENMPFIIHMLFWPSLCSAVFIILALIVYCHCCPRCYIE